ncbi:MAG: monomethylamine:corrinoid methyltransferase, partial [Dehalobacterium sp.]
AVNRNLNLICGGGGLTCAGPGTEMQLWEIVVQGIHTSAAGGHIVHGVRKAKLVKPNQGTGMEPRWEAENARAAAGLSRDDVNELVNYAFTKYEHNLHVDKAPQGFSFEELYNPETVEIRPHYLELYHKVKSEMEKQGLHYD